MQRIPPGMNGNRHIVAVEIPPSQYADSIGMTLLIGGIADFERAVKSICSENEYSEEARCNEYHRE